MRVIHPGLAATDAGDASARRDPAWRGNRRRLAVFLAVFLVCAVAGMAWNLLRPAEYRALARIQVTLPSIAAAASAPAGDLGADLAAQVQRLGSRPLIEQAHQRLVALGLRLDPAEGDPVSRIQRMVAVALVPGSTVIELAAVGSPPALLAAALNELIGAYREQLFAAYGSAGDERIDQLRDELARLEQAAAQRRARLEQFRGSANIASGEREENEAVARTRGLATALNNAVEKQATAEARLRALQEAVDKGQGVVSARDDPTLAGLEARASQLREELRELGRVYTEEFLAMDQRARAMRTRLGELEAQIVQRRAVSQENALAKAQEEAVTTRANVERLQQQQAAERQGLRSFSARFAQAKAMEDDLTSVERARREALERLARLEANQKARQPAVEVLQPATAPDAAWRPDYLRDGALVLAGSFALGLLAMGVVELFNRPARAVAAAPMTVVVPTAWGAALPNGAAAAALPATGGTPWLGHDANAPRAVALPPPPPPRELAQDEAAALLAAARGPSRLACALWLLGLSTDEATSLRRADVDTAALRLRVGGTWAREVPLPSWFAEALPAVAGDAPLLGGADGRPMGSVDLQTMLACAAIDAGLPDATAVTPQRLRHTAMAWWVREGLRLADLPARVGRLDPQELGALAEMAQAAPRRGADEVEALMPALRLAPA